MPEARTLIHDFLPLASCVLHLEMYTVIVYDVAEERVNRVRKYLKRFLNWVQNSAFEGELTVGQIERIKAGLGDIIDSEEDSVYFYVARDKKWLKKEILGQDKNLMDSIL